MQEVVQEAAGDGEEGGGEEMAEVDIVGTMSIHQAFSTGRRRSACVLDDHPRRCSNNSTDLRRGQVSPARVRSPPDYRISPVNKREQIDCALVIGMQVSSQVTSALLVG